MTISDPEAHRPTVPTWHIGVRRRLIPYRAFEEGRLLPPRRSWTQGVGQIVTEWVPATDNRLGVARIYDFDAPDDDREKTYSRQVSPTGGLSFPALRKPVPEEFRPPASRPGDEPLEQSIDWRRMSTPPTAGELQAGDVLPSRYEGPAIDQPHEDGPQRVVKVSMAWDGRLYVTTRDYKTTRRGSYFPSEVLTFPQPRDTERTRISSGLNSLQRKEARLRAIREAEVLDTRRSPHTKQVFVFIKHPYGRGRWPAEVMDFDYLAVHKEGRPLVVREPTGERQIMAYSEMEPVTDIASLGAFVYSVANPNDLFTRAEVEAKLTAEYEAASKEATS